MRICGEQRGVKNSGPYESRRCSLWPPRCFLFNCPKREQAPGHKTRNCHLQTCLTTGPNFFCLKFQNLPLDFTIFETFLSIRLIVNDENLQLSEHVSYRTYSRRFGLRNALFAQFRGEDAERTQSEEGNGKTI